MTESSRERIAGGAVESMQVERLPVHLSAIAERASEVLEHRARRATFLREVARALPWLAVVPVAHIGLQLLRWGTGGPPELLAPLVLAAVAGAATLVWAWITARERPAARAARTAALFAADRQLGLEERLVAADAFLNRREISGFERAAIEDAAARSRAALDAAFSEAPERVPLARPIMGWALLMTALVGVSIWVAHFEPRDLSRAALSDTQLAAAGAPVDAVGVDETDPGDERSEEPAPPEPEPRVTVKSAESKRAEAAPELSEVVKESRGKTGSGRSSGALSTSSASESQSAPSSKGQESEQSSAPPKTPPKAAPQPKPRKDAPPPPEENDEESGATAGKGSSKGSNKNPTASDWKSKDQVTDTDDQEVEADEEVDDDEEEQENRGGVQPSLRDRRPPVSRDLTIGFGNRPNPDANGRGGPSEQKKSRGVASLVLGVPVPDRVKGRPGPGPTKVTQERIEPEAEEATSVAAGSVTPRSEPLDAHRAPDLEPAMRELVRRYFLARRAATRP